MEFRFSTTGVGSVPWMNVEDSCRLILERLPEMPFWPQFVKLSPLEDMVVQFSEGLPGIRMKNDGKTLFATTGAVEEEMVVFYEKFLADDVDAFPLSPDRARGFYALLDLIEDIPLTGEQFIKGQSVGPITFASSVSLEDGRHLIHDPGLFDAAVKSLSIKLLWQTQALSRTGRRPVLFIDEPALAGIGSAFVSLNREVVVGALRETIDYLKSRSEALVGVHCCANTEWPLVFESGPDIISFDAFGFMDSFLLYPEETSRFLDEGGTIAWGIVPTSAFSKETTADTLHDLLERGIRQLAERGVNEDRLRVQSILTPACGMGGMSREYAEYALNLLSELNKRMR